MATRRGALTGVLRNCIVAVTGVSDVEKKRMRGAIAALGGKYSEVLDEKVTHLVANEAGSAKHRAANLLLRQSSKGRPIIIKSSWIDGCVSARLRVDHEPHLLPPLAGFEISPSGLPAEEKVELARMAPEVGAVLKKTMGIQCTHLLIMQPVGPKYDFAKRSRSINIVRPAWFHDCVKERLLLDESKYALENQNRDRTESGAGYSGADCGSVANTITGSRVVSTISQPADDLAAVEPSMLFEAHVFFITGCALWDAEKYGPLRARALRLASLSGATLSSRWSPLVNHVLVVTVPIAAAQVGEIKRAEMNGIVVVGLDWLEKCVLAGKVLPVDAHPPPPWGVAATKQAGAMSQTPLDPPSASQPAVTSVIFQGVRLALGPLALRDPDLCASVSMRMMSGRGKMLAHDASGFVTSGVPTHVACPPDLHKGEQALLASIRAKNARVVPVTSYWVDSCVTSGTLLPASSCILFRTIEHPLPLRVMKERKVTVTISGFQAVPASKDWNRRREVLAKLATLLGMKYSEVMRRRQTSHLVAEPGQTGGSDKLVRAKDWGIPVVSYKWLLACANAGTLATTTPYLIDGGGAATPTPYRRTQTPEEAAPRRKRRAPDTPGTESGRRKSPRFAKESASQESPGMGESAVISLFQRFVAGANGSGNANRPEEAADVGPRTRGRTSRSASRDAAPAPVEWSLDASQSQLIVHRDLTPPPK